MIFVGVGTIGILIPFLFLWLRKPSWKQADADARRRRG